MLEHLLRQRPRHCQLPPRLYVLVDRHDFQDFQTVVCTASPHPATPPQLASFAALQQPPAADAVGAWRASG
jgi:hypothetical protein